MPEQARTPLPRFTHVAVATDFSAGSEAALSRAAELPLSPRARITVVHVLPDRLPRDLHRTAERQAQEQLDAVTGRLERALQAQGRSGVFVSSVLSEGSSYGAILAAVKSVAAQLLVVGRHGPRPLRDMFIGSTAERVVRVGAVPVLVVKEPPRGAYARPLVAVDLGEGSRAVTELAQRVLEPDVEATLLHAARVPYELLLGKAAAARARDEAARRADLELAGLARDAGGFSPTVMPGDPRAVILSLAARRRADLIVVGSHEGTSLGAALLGSTAERVLERASCDVLVGRQDRTRTGRR